MAILVTVIQLYVVVLIVAAILTWFPASPSSPLNPIRRVVGAVTDPVLSVVRRVVPPIPLGGASLDLSVILLVVVLEVVARILPT
ncbi:MAG: YggT family protein [Actinomycetota bacterium]|nr:YggT family protein [Actinomycetota bacterium]